MVCVFFKWREIELPYHTRKWFAFVKSTWYPCFNQYICTVLMLDVDIEKVVPIILIYMLVITMFVHWIVWVLMYFKIVVHLYQNPYGLKGSLRTRQTIRCLKLTAHSLIRMRACFPWCAQIMDIGLCRENVGDTVRI